MSDGPPPRIEYRGSRYVSSAWLCNYLIQFADKLEKEGLVVGARTMENLCAGILLEDLMWNDKPAE